MDSIVRGADTPPLLELTIGEALDAAVARVPDSLALISRHQGIGTFLERAVVPTG